MKLHVHLAEFWATTRQLFRPIWLRVSAGALATWGAVTLLADVASQALPKHLAEKSPNAYEAIVYVGGLLTFWQWLVVALALLNVAAIRFYIKESQMDRANYARLQTLIEEAIGRSPIIGQISQELASLRTSHAELSNHVLSKQRYDEISNLLEGLDPNRPLEKYAYDQKRRLDEMRFKHRPWLFKNANMDQLIDKEIRDSGIDPSVRATTDEERGKRLAIEIRAIRRYLEEYRNSLVSALRYKDRR